MTKIVLAYIETMDLPYSKISMTIVQMKDLKNSTNYFEENGLSLKIECNVITLNDLDITLDLNTGAYKP